jgi:hypothetical protein
VGSKVNGGGHFFVSGHAESYEFNKTGNGKMVGKILILNQFSGGHSKRHASHETTKHKKLKVNILHFRDFVRNLVFEFAHFPFPFQLFHFPHNVSRGGK